MDAKTIQTVYATLEQAGQELQKAWDKHVKQHGPDLTPDLEAIVAANSAVTTTMILVRTSPDWVEPEVSKQDDDTIYYDQPCPVCGSQVEFDLDCPGWTTTGRSGNPVVMVCDGCGNAELFTCTNENCNWWYRSPNNRGDRAYMGVKPDWILKRERE